MEDRITLREAKSEADITSFWSVLRAYFRRDIFPDPHDEDLPYFLGEAYTSQIEILRTRKTDRCRFLYFCRDGEDIGFAMPVIYDSEDGKCFIMEFCIYPAFRGSGTGKTCAQILLEWAQNHGAEYFELNCGNERRRRFWESVGFIPNGVDEWGEPLMLLPPREDSPIVVSVLTEADDWQLPKLENGYLTEIGEEVLTEEKAAALTRAIQCGKITFFVARRGTQAVGMCSVVRCFSTFACSDVGILEDFYIEPAFRRKGIARMLIRAAQDWCREKGIASLTVCCASCDEAMYGSLGFTMQLGGTWACLL